MMTMTTAMMIQPQSHGDTSNYDGDGGGEDDDDDDDDITTVTRQHK